MLNLTCRSVAMGLLWMWTVFLEQQESSSKMWRLLET